MYSHDLVVFTVEGTLLDDSSDDVAGHHPVRGLLDIARWFDAQPLTHVALVSLRPERDRAAVRRSLDAVGREYRLGFRDDLLHLRADDDDGDDVAHRREALGGWRARGFRLVAVIDADDRALASLRTDDAYRETLFLSASSLLRSRRAPARPHSPAAGHVELVWHGINDLVRLGQFLASPLRWGEVDLRCDPDGRLAVRHDDFDAAGTPDDTPSARGVVEAFRDAGKGLTLDVKEPEALGAALRLIADVGLPPNAVCVNGRVDKLGERGLRHIGTSCPGARIQCPVEFLGPMVVALPAHARGVLTTVRSWGVDRFSMAWTHPQACDVLSQLETWGLDVNLYAVTDRKCRWGRVTRGRQGSGRSPEGQAAAGVTATS